MNGFRLFGRLLGYPECCIDYFCENSPFIGDFVSYNGFVPCPVHQRKTKVQIEKEIGRSLNKEPLTFCALIKAMQADESADLFLKGYEVYSLLGEGDFFLKCCESK